MTGAPMDRRPRLAGQPSTGRKPRPHETRVIQHLASGATLPDTCDPAEWVAHVFDAIHELDLRVVTSETVILR